MGGKEYWMYLVLGEKPSVAQAYAKVLGAKKRQDGYLEGNGWLVSWCLGHLAEYVPPEEYDEKYRKWEFSDLPILPEEWRLSVAKDKKAQFTVLKKLLNRKDVEYVVNGCDAGREGELIFRRVYELSGSRLPVKRIWISSMEDTAIREGFAHLKDGAEYQNLYGAAVCRAKADWLIGMNLSRAYTLSERYKGHKVTLPIGRVKTPTLALVVRRERELAAFKPVDYFTVKVLYNHPNGVFWATWQPTDEQKGLDPDGRLINKAIADELVERLQAGPDGFIKGVTKSKKKDVQRLPLSLSSLQVLAGKAFSYDPQTVLDTAQKLYEKKLTTYPRSDCEYLPPNQYDDRNAILNNLQNAGDERLAQWAADADRSIKSRAWNEKKITAHHAIIPTTVACNINSLFQEERNIYFLISQAYIAQFYGEHIYEQTKIVVEQCKEEFVANGRVVIEEGWKLLYKRHKSKSTTDNDEPDLTDERGAESDPKKEVIEETDHLPAVKKNDTVLYTDSSIEAKQTKPPSRFTPSTLLQAMKEIHKFVKNEDLKKQLKAVSGIGTEATRANIIDELISRGFMKTSGKKQVLSPTETGYLLVDALPEELLYPDETAVWEERLALMSEGEDTLDSFLADQIKFLKLLIDKLGFDKVVSSDQMMPNVVRTITSQNRKRPMDSESVDLSSLPVCPKCKKGRLQQRNGKFGAFLGCTNYPTCKHTQPVEGDTSSVEGNIEVSDEDKQYKCPRCNVGYFVKQEVRGRTNWICSNRSQCKTQCSDVDGVPSIYANK